jgi:hypothetical protein
MKNLACNLIYNNGDEAALVGFKGRCDVKNIKYNIELDKDRWCSQQGCSCKKYYDRGFKGATDNYPCNESRLFEDWEWNPGNEFKTGKPFRILKSGEGKIAILTTRFPNSPESERKIIGFLKIEEIVDNYNVIALKEQSIRLTLDEAHELDFWNYHINSKSAFPIWRQGRFRYLDDIQVAAIFHDLRSIVQNDSTKALLRTLLDDDFSEYSEDRPDVDGAIPNSFSKKVLLKRKYGKGGESQEHMNLKEFIANNPRKIGLNPKEVTAKVEHAYVSGDLVDILFAPKVGFENTVVEIELNNVVPGIHQAIKYRVLRCSQLGLSLNDKSVKATVVAWYLSAKEKMLCKKYGIEFYEIKL